MAKDDVPGESLVLMDCPQCACLYSVRERITYADFYATLVQTPDKCPKCGRPNRDPRTADET